MGRKRTASQSTSRIVCVAGMGRSGTSMTMRLLNLLGVYLGPPDGLIPPGGGNPSGFWEHRKLLDLDDAILERLGGSWHEPPAFPPGWESAAELADLRREGRAIIRENFEGAVLWGWKQPRSCLTLPLWQKLLPDMGYVICLRNPLDVAFSMEKATGFTFAKCINLWFTYTAAAVEHTAGKPRIFVFYEHLLEDWRGELRRLAEFIDRPFSPDDVELQTQVEAFIDEELHHHRSTMTEAVDAPELAFAAKSLYFSLRAMVQGSRSRYLEGVDDREELEEALNIFATCAREEHAALKQKDTLLAERDALLVEKATALAERDALLTEKDAALAQGEEALAEATHQLEAIRQSFGFRLLQAYRRGIRRLFPPGSLRGRPYRIFMQGLKAIVDRFGSLLRRRRLSR